MLWLQFLSSWWWTEKPHEKCRALTIIKDIVKRCILLIVPKRIHLPFFQQDLSYNDSIYPVLGKCQNLVFVSIFKVIGNTRTFKILETQPNSTVSVTQDTTNINTESPSKFEIIC
jgi:hypothetical protein